MSATDSLTAQGGGCRGVPLYTKVSIYGAVFLGFNYILLRLIFAFDAGTYDHLTYEDSWVEYGTAILLLLTAVLLFAVAAMGGRGMPGRWLYILGALAFVFGAGEEISWGQRILGFETPGFLLGINPQGEFNFHNIKLDDAEGVMLNRAMRVGLLFLCAVTLAAHFARRSSFFGIPYPSILTTYCFLLVHASKSAGILARFPIYFSSDFNLLLIVGAVYGWFAQNRRLFTMSALFLAGIFFVQAITNYFTVLSPNKNYVWEVHEYLFSIASIVYASELFLASRAVSKKANCVEAAGQ